MNSEWLSAVANHLWQSTLATAVAGLLVLMLRKHGAHVRYWIWFAASVKFLVPFSLLITLGTGVGWRSRAMISPASSIALMVTEVTLPFAMSATPDRSQAAGTAPTFAGLPTIVGAIWLIGVITVLLLWAGSWLRMAKIVRRASPLVLAEKCPAVVSPALLEPSVFGIFRSVLVLPQGIEERLSHEQLEAVIAHEKCHIYRRDNLLSSIHMVVAATFWFYPVVWWVGMRLLDERERACDEQVLKQGSDPLAYAEGILKLCKSYLESPLRCASGVSGANLQRRINAIVSGSVAKKLSFARVFLLAVAATAALVIPFAVGLVKASPASQVKAPAQDHAQSAESLSFEVVSIKPNIAGGPSSVVAIDKHRFVGTNLTIKNVILLAYKLQEYQIIGIGPALASARFDIEAKADDQTKPEQIADMIKSMLADRFKLRLHHETRELPVYALVPAKNGPKLKPNTTGSEDHSSRTLRGKMYGQNVPMETLVTHLSNALDRMVTDQTGLAGTFDWGLEWSPEASRAGVADAGGRATEPTGPSIFTAVQEQLGLRLEATKAPLDALIIDSVEQPSEN